jgi:hypothetical protein
MRLAEHSDTQLILLDFFFILYLIFICLVDEGNSRKVKKKRENDKREKEKN